jgi:hypothetical protein
VTTFGPLTLSVPRARLADEAGEREWNSTLLPAYKRLSHRAEALIAEAYLAGMNTRRVRRALAKLFEDHVGKDVVSRAWQRTRSAWMAWQERDLASLASQRAREMRQFGFVLRGIPLRSELANRIAFWPGPTLLSVVGCAAMTFPPSVQVHSTTTLSTVLSHLLVTATIAAGTC